MTIPSGLIDSVRTVKQLLAIPLARQLSLHVGTVYDLIKAGKIPGVVRVGNRIRIPTARLDEVFEPEK